MSTRRGPLVDLPTPRSRAAPEKGLSLDPRRWAWMPKIDGVLARISTDLAGRVTSLLHRSGSPVPTSQAIGLVGAPIGLPDAVLWAEIEASTEAGIRAAETRGWPAAHLFDVTRANGVNVARLPFGERYGLLHRWQAAAENYGEVPEAEVMVRDERTFLWSLPGERPRERLLAPKGTMVPSGIPRDLRRFPIVPLARGKGAGESLWRKYVEIDGGEGVVAVRLDAPAGARSAKVKVKRTDDLDCVVVGNQGGVAALLWKGHELLVSARGKWTALRPGDIVSVRCDGFYEASVTPRFARVAELVRRRDDLTGRHDDGAQVDRA